MINFINLCFSSSFDMKPEIKLHDKTFVPSIPYEKISAAIDDVAAKLNADNAGRTDIPVLICILNGSIMFTSELMQRLDFDLELVCMKVSSYQGIASTGNVHQVMGLTGSVKGKRVYIVEDIIDSGRTIAALHDILKGEGAESVDVCTMLFKPGAYKKNIPIKYVGLNIPDDFIVGFGLDYDGLGRNYKDIYVLKTD